MSSSHKGWFEIIKSKVDGPILKGMIENIESKIDGLIP